MRRNADTKTDLPVRMGRPIFATGSFLRTVRQKRCGIIPYTVHDGSVFFLFARDRESGDVCDFGGSVARGETTLAGGMREFEEESLGIFGRLYDGVAVLDRDVCLVGYEAALVFHPVADVWLACAAPAFAKEAARQTAAPAEDERTRRARNEVSDVAWNSEHEFEQLLARGSKLWHRLGFFLRQGVDSTFIPALKTAFVGRAAA